MLQTFQVANFPSPQRNQVCKQGESFSSVNWARACQVGERRLAGGLVLRLLARHETRVSTPDRLLCSAALRQYETT